MVSGGRTAGDGVPRPEYHARTRLGSGGFGRYFPNMNSYASILEAVESLSEDEQESLVDVLQLRLAERRRANLIATVRESRAEQAGGVCPPATVAEIMRRIVR